MRVLAAANLLTRRIQAAALRDGIIDLVLGVDVGAASDVTQSSGPLARLEERDSAIEDVGGGRSAAEERVQGEESQMHGGKLGCVVGMECEEVLLGELGVAIWIVEWAKEKVEWQNENEIEMLAASRQYQQPWSSTSFVSPSWPLAFGPCQAFLHSGKLKAHSGEICRSTPWALLDSGIPE